MRIIIVKISNRNYNNIIKNIKMIFKMNNQNKGKVIIEKFRRI